MFVGGIVMTSVYAYLAAHHFAPADATAIATVVSSAAAGLVLTVGSALFSQLDAKSVDQQQKAAVTDTASTVARGIASGATTPADIQNAVQNDHGALQQALKALKAGNA
jgi:hypothetical protein